MEPVKPLQMLGGRNYSPEQRPKDDVHHLTADTVVSRVGNAMFGETWVDGQRTGQWREVVDHIADEARSGRLHAFHWYVGYTAIEASQWSRLDVADLFATGKFRWLRSGNWVYFDEPGVRALLYRLKASKQTSSPFEYDMSAHRWHLFDVAIWVATGGKSTTTEVIAADGLEDVGCRRLFETLSVKSGPSVPQISGISRLLEVRQPLLSTYLERAHTGWLGEREGHMVRFYETKNPDDPNGPSIIVADFTPKNHTEPTLINLSMEREAVMALFPMQDRPIATTTSWQPQIDLMLNLMEKDPKMFAKAAARKVAPDQLDALYRAFRTRHPDKTRGYFRE
jgi:hypothetical protein